MTLRDFIARQLEADEAAARAAAVDVERAPIYLSAAMAEGNHRHGLARALRDGEAARSILDRHTPLPPGPRSRKRDPRPCEGCNFDYGDIWHAIDNIEDCPELHDLAWRWHTEQDWDPRWCPHHRVHPVETTAHSDPRRVVVNICDHCGGQDRTGRHYEPRTEAA